MTLRKYLGSIGAKADSGGCYSTSTICEAIYGSMHVEKLGLIREHRKKAALHNAILEGSLVDKTSLMRMFSQVADAMTSRITASNLSRDEQSDLLRELSSVPISIDGIVAEQSRLPRGLRHDGDGENEEDAEDEEGSQPQKGKRTKKSRKVGSGRIPTS
jgi:hypothetical protein